jgi:cell division protein FtsI (penicillin-binding protein 3)
MKKQEYYSHKHRYTLVFISFAILYISALVYLYIVQIYNAPFFKHLAQTQHNSIIKTQPERAPIYDRHKKILACSKDVYAGFVTPRDIKDKDKLISFLLTHFPESVEKLETYKNKHFMYIKRRLSDQDIETIHASDIEDIHIIKENGRMYTDPCLSSIIGLTNIDNQGVAGLEYMFNTQLQGTPSVSCIEKDARSGCFYFKKIDTVKGKQGTPLHLTIDADLQFLVNKELEYTMHSLSAEEGAVIIVNPENGDVLSLATQPTFDANHTEHLNIEQTKNKVATHAYELGSVIKAFLALAALEEKIYATSDPIDCLNTRRTHINGIRVNTWKSHGVLSMSEVIQYSNNIGTSKIALSLGHKLYHHYKRLGFTQPTGLFPGENAGYMTPPHKWSKASPLSLSFGYEISTTIMQLARAMSIIANGGYDTRLSLIQKNTPHHCTDNTKLYSDYAVTSLKDILEKTINSGTARRARIKGYRIMGKTGTAYTLENRTYNKNKSVYTFVSMIEKGSYKRVIVTFVKNVKKKNAYASTVAVPLFERVAQKMLIHDKVF